jgi:DNA helicase-2/ATP-dependent DNA helicase PcrA
VEFEKRAEQKAAERAVERAAASPASAGPDGSLTAAPSAEPGGNPYGVPGFPPAFPEEDDDLFAAGLPGYLTRLALDSKDADGDGGDCVTLMTLHGAKGLEWRCVFLGGLEEGLLPHSGRGFEDASGEPTADGAMNLDEERRLAYVGLTRARERLTLTRAAERLRRGKPLPRTPSRFLEDIPQGLVDLIDLGVPQPESAKEVRETKAKSFFSQMSSLLGEPKP